MSSASSMRHDQPQHPDDRVVLHGLSWWQFEAMLAVRGDQAGVRVAYLEGDEECSE